MLTNRYSAELVTTNINTTSMLTNRDSALALEDGQVVKHRFTSVLNERTDGSGPQQNERTDGSGPQQFDRTRHYTH